MKIGIIKTSLKENEKRLPIHPEHIFQIKSNVLRSLYFENGYGEMFGFQDDDYSSVTTNFASREDLFNSCDMLIIPKPVLQDYKDAHYNQILCGWHHCVQQYVPVQQAIEKTLTLISWENMHLWDNFGNKKMHIFYKNNEIAGYSAILHSLQLLGLDGHYGDRKKVVVLGYGSVAKGAIYALHGRGFNNIHVYTARSTHLVNDQNPDVYYHQFKKNLDLTYKAYHKDGSVTNLIDDLSEADIICNCVLQDTKNPYLFISDCEVGRIKKNALIVDISCDEGMGFSFAIPTSFKNPIIKISDFYYYSVDHTPSYLWQAATREISFAIIQYLQILIDGSVRWKEDLTIKNSIDIENGIVKNQDILHFQNRSHDFPFQMLK